MLQFFSKTRNITGLVLLIGPMLAVLTGDRPVSFWAPFFAAMTLSLPLLRIALQNLPFRLSASVFTAAFCFGIFQSQVHPELSALLLGCGSSMLLLLPPLLMTGQFPGSWVQTLALTWSFSILTMPCFRASGFLFLPAMAAGVFFLKKPSESWKYCYTPLILEQRKLYLKPAFFTAVIAASLLICLSMAVSVEGASRQTFQPEAAFWLCLGAAPLLAAFFAEKKGVFGSCILLIFLCEATMLFLSFFSGPKAFLAGRLLLALAAGTVTVILPLLAFYLYGHVNYLQHLSRLLFALPLGLFFSVPFLQMSQRGEMKPDEAAILLIFLLLMGAFCIFFAWKQRFIILKNEIM